MFKSTEKKNYKYKYLFSKDLHRKSMTADVCSTEQFLGVPVTGVVSVCRPSLDFDMPADKPPPP